MDRRPRIIVVGVAVLPFLKVGGMQLFRTESSDRSEKLFGRVNQIAAAMLYVYGGLSVLCAALYWVGGMTVFEATVHAMTTLSTGGYSTSDQSFSHFANPFVHWTGTVFMLAGGLPVVPLAHALTGGVRNLFANSQIRAILSFLAVVIATLTLWLWVRTDIPLADALRMVAFTSFPSSPPPAMSTPTTCSGDRSPSASSSCCSSSVDVPARPAAASRSSAFRSSAGSSPGTSGPW